jgi:hypothetical protein
MSVMSESTSDGTSEALALDPRDARLVDGAARWMGMLGRFQVLFGGLTLFLIVGAGLALWLTDAADGSDASATTPPLVTLGEVDPLAVAAVAAAIAGLAALLVRGGTLLIDAAEDFERYLAQLSSAQASTPRPDGDALLLDGLRRLGTYFVLESLLVAVVLAAVVFAGGGR